MCHKSALMHDYRINSLNHTINATVFLMATNTTYKICHFLQTGCSQNEQTFCDRIFATSGQSVQQSNTVDS